MQINNGKIKLLIAEEQKVWRETYCSYFASQHNIDMVGGSVDPTGDSVAKAASALNPDVILLGFKVLNPDTVNSLEAIRQSCPNTAIVLLSGNYDINSFIDLKEFFQKTPVGCAYLLKHNIDTNGLIIVWDVINRLDAGS